MKLLERSLINICVQYIQFGRNSFLSLQSTQAISFLVLYRREVALIDNPYKFRTKIIVIFGYNEFIKKKSNIIRRKRLFKMQK